jgi:hypothetical protein
MERIFQFTVAGNVLIRGFSLFQALERLLPISFW